MPTSIMSPMRASWVGRHPTDDSPGLMTKWAPSSTATSAVLAALDGDQMEIAAAEDRELADLEPVTRS